MRPRGQPVFVAYIHVGVLPAENGKPLVLRWVLRRIDVDAEAGEGSTREALADFAGSVAEELRAPLIPIVEWARSLRDCDVRDEEERQKALGWIERSAQAQKAKLDELAEFARTYREGPEAQVTDVLEVAEQAAHLEGEWSRVLLRCETESNPLRVLASSLLRALDLLLQRALEGTPRAFKVELRVRAHAGEVRIDIVAGEGAASPTAGPFGPLRPRGSSSDAAVASASPRVPPRRTSGCLACRLDRRVPAVADVQLGTQPVLRCGAGPSMTAR